MLKVILATRPPVNLSGVQKAHIFHERLEHMRDELDHTHVTHQQNDPDDATYMINGYVELLEVIPTDFIVHGFPSNAGARQHVDEHLVRAFKNFVSGCPTQQTFGRNLCLLNR